jgi:hypothetical protein
MRLVRAEGGSMSSGIAAGRIVVEQAGRAPASRRNLMRFLDPFKAVL